MSDNYNRTFHFPFSPGATNDDKIATSMERLIEVPIVITEKIDGSCASLESDGCYARTHSGPPTHASFDLFKSLHASVKHLIPAGYQLFGENCFAKHSIAYNELPGYFLLFAVKADGMWLSWADVERWAATIGVPTVPLLGKHDPSCEAELVQIVQDEMKEPSRCGGLREGVVARVASEFVDADFGLCVLKAVRAGHVQTDVHWKHQQIVKNKLKESNQ
jgi:hypothetical protein